MFSGDVVNVAFCLWCCDDNKGLMVVFRLALLLRNNMNVMNKKILDQIVVVSY